MKRQELVYKRPTRASWKAQRCWNALHHRDRTRFSKNVLQWHLVYLPKVSRTHTQHDCVLAFLSELHGSCYKIGFVGIRCSNHLSGRSEEDKGMEEGWKSNLKQSQQIPTPWTGCIPPPPWQWHPSKSSWPRERGRPCSRPGRESSRWRSARDSGSEGRGQGVTREVTEGKIALFEGRRLWNSRWRT